MIELKHISKSYGNQLVLSDLNLTFEKGEICMLLGPSGCGKSTLLKLINRLLSPDSGEIYIDGKPGSDFPQEELRRSMGYAIQSVGLFPHMTVGENIATVPNLLKWEKHVIHKRVDELLELVGLPIHYGKKYPSQLSGGEAQRIGVARALAADPDILLMDEPFGALDPINRLRIQQEFLKIQKQLHKTVIFVTHDVGEAIRMADKLVVMNDGKIIAKGDPVSIAHEAESVAKAFLGNSYTLELLEKQYIHQHLSGFQLGNQDDVMSEIGLESTFKDVLSQMLMNGSSDISFKIENQIYHIDFEDLIGVFKGAKL